jgi:TOBE domain
VSSGWLPLPTGQCGTKGEVVTASYQGATIRLSIDSGDTRLMASIPPGGHVFVAGETVNLYWKRESMVPMEEA